MFSRKMSSHNFKLIRFPNKKSFAKTPRDAGEKESELKFPFSYTKKGKMTVLDSTELCYFEGKTG
jgi:hypothetical protein